MKTKALASPISIVCPGCSSWSASALYRPGSTFSRPTSRNALITVANSLRPASAVGATGPSGVSSSVTQRYTAVAAKKIAAMKRMLLRRVAHRRSGRAVSWVDGVCMLPARPVGLITFIYGVRTVRGCAACRDMYHTTGGERKGEGKRIRGDTSVRSDDRLTCHHVQTFHHDIIMTRRHIIAISI